MLGGVAAAGVAVGPLIGGWTTTNFSWRYVFVAETIVVIAIVLGARRISDVARAVDRPRLDGVVARQNPRGRVGRVLTILRPVQGHRGAPEPARPGRARSDDLAAGWGAF